MYNIAHFICSCSIGRTGRNSVLSVRAHIEFRGHDANAARCRLPAANSGTTTWHCGGERSSGARGVGVGAVRNSPGREHHWTKCGVEFNSFSLNGHVSRERCLTQPWLGNHWRKKRVRKQRRGCWAEDAAVTKTRTAPKIEISRSAWCWCWLLGFLFLTFSCTRPHLAEPWQCDEGVRFLEASWVSETQSAVTRAARGVLHNFDPSIFHVIAS